MPGGRCWPALELRQRLHASPTLHALRAGDVLDLGMGLHSGLVVVGGLGHDRQRLATAVGAPLHVATRLQQQATPGMILLSAATYQLVHAEVQAAPSGTLTLDGPLRPVSMYVVQGLRRRQAGVVGRGPRRRARRQLAHQRHVDGLGWRRRVRRHVGVGGARLISAKPA